MLKSLLSVFFILLFAAFAGAQSPWFPLTLPWEDNSRAFIDASDLLVDYPGQDPATVIDARGRVIARPDGHFYFEKTGKRARFWGVNFTFNASFPPCPDQPLRAGEFSDIHAAEKIARRLAKLGVNVIRFHHMDTSRSPDGIWDRNYYGRDTQHLDPAQIKRLDYLISQLRKNGIYANINLKVGRHFESLVCFASKDGDDRSFRERRSLDVKYGADEGPGILGLGHSERSHQKKSEADK